MFADCLTQQTDAVTTRTTTVTSTSTSALTETPTLQSTTTVTNTQTSTAYTSTIFGACATPGSNFVGTVSGVGGNTAFSNNNQDFNTAQNPAMNGGDFCCNACLAASRCVGTGFEVTFPVGQQCFLILSLTADQSAPLVAYSLAAVINNLILPPGGGYLMSNGQCGQFDTISQ
jgi:hypothetical protein